MVLEDEDKLIRKLRSSKKSFACSSISKDPLEFTTVYPEADKSSSPNLDIIHFGILNGWWINRFQSFGFELQEGSEN